MANLPADLEKAKIQIEQYARDYGLDFFETIFEMISFDQMNQFASYGGFPVRYPHWKWGMEYESMSKGYEYGLSKIYEMVINTDPCYAYLMEGNEFLDQKLVKSTDRKRILANRFRHCRTAIVEAGCELRGKSIARDERLRTIVLRRAALEWSDCPQSLSPFPKHAISSHSNPAGIRNNRW